jgi:RNA polymerase sigma factor (sigma-70 family)
MMSDDDTIISGVRAGEPAAVAALVDTYSRRLLRTAILLCGCEQDAQDAVQETLITALKAIHRFRGGSTLSTWLHGILINVTRHLLRALDTGAPSQNFRFASAVAEFGLLLRDAQFKGTAGFDAVLDRARGAKGADDDGYRAEFIRLVEQAQLLPHQ